MVRKGLRIPSPSQSHIFYVVREWKMFSKSLPRGKNLWFYVCLSRQKESLTLIICSIPLYKLLSWIMNIKENGLKVSKVKSETSKFYFVTLFLL